MLPNIAVVIAAKAGAVARRLASRDRTESSAKEGTDASSLNRSADHPPKIGLWTTAAVLNLEKVLASKTQKVSLIFPAYSDYYKFNDSLIN